MPRSLSRCALSLLLFVLGSGPAMSALSEVESPVAAAESDGLFPLVVEAHVAGRREQLRLTGTAVRKKLGIAFFRIAGYCDTDESPVDVDALAAADIPKRLILVMQRDVSEWVLRRSFTESFQNNDPEHRFPGEIKTLLDYMTAESLKKGETVTLTHLPRQGVECRVGDKPPVIVADREFAHVVWKIYMGPRACSPDLRKGLGEHLVDRDGDRRQNVRR